MQLDGEAQQKASVVEEVGSKQTALDHAEQGKKEAVAELAELKERLQASLASKDETVKVSLQHSNARFGDVIW